MYEAKLNSKTFGGDGTLACLDYIFFIFFIFVFITVFILRLEAFTCLILLTDDKKNIANPFS